MELFSFVLYAVIAFSVVLFAKRRRSSLPLPPGPRRLPIVGNLFNRPVYKTWLTYTDWRARYGDVVSMEVLGQPVIVINSAKGATELFEKRSSNYADRPPFHMANDLMKWAWNFNHMRYSDEWRLHRKTFHQYFAAKEVLEYRPVQMATTRTLLKLMLQTPEDFFTHVRYHAASIILRLTYGYDAEPLNDRNVALADKALRGVMYALVVGNYLVDYLPILKRVPAWMPFAKFQREAEIAGRDAIAMRDKPFEELLKSMDAGTAVPSFVSVNIENFKQGDSDSRFNMTEVVRNCAGIAFGAGADTTVSVILSALLALVHHPEIQAKAHAELDEIVGRKRLPDFDDQDDLKYIQAIVLESMRWRPVTPLAMPHASVSDDTYEGYFIPAGSVVYGNAWAILHDEATYPDAEAFIPERFMGDHPQSDPTTLGVFGFGRRICPGRHLAGNSTFIAVAALLWAFDFVPRENETLPDVHAYTDGAVSHPLPFKCKIVPRFEEVASLIQSS
ncbi:cytochrome P450 [Hymenopellis radicata]|nr:cytochrome P450 [Hymenopellis radicata]